MTLTAVRHETASGRWELVSTGAHPTLWPHVRRYAGFAEHGSERVRRREPVNGDVVLIVSFGPSIVLHWPDRPETPAERRTSFLVGMHAPVTVTEHDGVSEGVQIDLTPTGAHMLLGMPMHLVAGQVLDLDVALPGLGAELPERLAAAPGCPARFALLDAVLARRLAAARDPSPDVMQAWRRLRETNGRLPVNRLAAELRCSRRHLSGRFREQIGVTPKAAARVIRFHHALDRLRVEGGGRWAEIAAECGYYDQSHLHRDFRAYAGLTPGEMEARLMAQGLGVAG
jgi:AraC-like DNA-binding protein